MFPKPTHDEAAREATSFRRREALLDALVDEALGFFQPEEDNGPAHEHMKEVIRQRFARVLSEH